MNLKTAPFFGELLCLEQPLKGSETLSVAQGCRDLIRYLVNDLIFHSCENIKNSEKNSPKIDVGNLIEFSSEARKKIMKLKKYLFKNLYRSEEINFMRREAADVVNVLFGYYLDSMNDIPKSLLENKFYTKFKNLRHRKLNLVGDFIAGLTDKEALEAFDKIRKKVK